MLQNNVDILCTKEIDPRLVVRAAGRQINIEPIPFIRIEQVVSYELSKKISTSALNPATVIFTSVHAVECIMPFLEGMRPSWKIFCTAPATAMIVTQLMPGTTIIGTAANAVALAQVISENAIEEKFLFFCGDKRRDELPEILIGKGYEVESFVVYKTVETPTLVSGNYNAIAFFSPSAVNSFFSMNIPDEKAILFAIGNTTADAIRKRSDNRIIVNETTNTESVIDTIIDYFKDQPSETFNDDEKKL